MIIVSCDPGVSNFALSRLKFGRAVKDFDILTVTMIKATVKNLKANVRQQLTAFRQEIDQHLKCDHLSMERYMSRGIKGNTSECVNMMIGATLYTTPCQLLTAASWKNAVNRVFSLPKLYRVCRAPPHIVDASMMAIYMAYKIRDEKPFADWTITEAARLVNQIHRQCSPKLFRRIPQRAKFIQELRQSFSPQQLARSKRSKSKAAAKRKSRVSGSRRRPRSRSKPSRSRRRRN